MICLSHIPESSMYKYRWNFHNKRSQIYADNVPKWVQQKLPFFQTKDPRVYPYAVPVHYLYILKRGMQKHNAKLPQKEGLTRHLWDTSAEFLNDLLNRTTPSKQHDNLISNKYNPKKLPDAHDKTSRKSNEYSVQVYGIHLIQDRSPCAGFNFLIEVFLHSSDMLRLETKNIYKQTSLYIIQAMTNSASSISHLRIVGFQVHKSSLLGSSRP